MVLFAIVLVTFTRRPRPGRRGGSSPTVGGATDTGSGPTKPAEATSTQSVASLADAGHCHQIVQRVATLLPAAFR